MAVENDSYCSEAQVVAYTQYLSDFTGSTTPTEAQLLVFMAQRAGELYALMAETLGSDAPGPAAYSTTVDTTTDAGKALNVLLQQQNAIGAAMDALSAAGAGEEPGRSERVAELFAMWTEGNKRVATAAKVYQGVAPVASQTATHISVGEITEATTVSREEDGLTFNGETDW
jgi:hypothetical protein